MSDEISVEIVEYAARIYHAFETFRKAGNYTNVRINRGTAIVIAKSWQDDLARYAEYHTDIGFERLNKCKQAAYLMYWIVKTKPVYLPLSQSNLLDEKYFDPEYTAINEVFAFTLCSDLLGLDPERNSAFYNKTYKQFRYDLYYRDINPKHLFLTLEILCEAMSA